MTALSIRAKGGEEQLAAIDVYDRANVFGRDLLERCDLYFKRSYYAAEVARLPIEWQGKIVPFGMNYAWHTSGKYWRAIAGPVCGHLRRVVSGGPGAVKDALLQVLMIPQYARFEMEPSVALRPEIVFQTRVWGQADCSTESIEPLYESRVALVRTLRKSFPEHFRGGVIPTKLARELGHNAWKYYQAQVAPGGSCAEVPESCDGGRGSRNDGESCGLVGEAPGASY